MPYNSSLLRGDSPTYSSTAGTHPLIPEDVQKDIVKGTIQKSAVLQMFKKRNMGTRQVRMPVLATKPTAYWVTGDSGLKQTTTQTWTNKFLNAEEIAVVVPIPVNLLEDTNDYDLWAEIKPEVEEAIGRALDAAVLFGTNKPASWPSDIKTAAIAAGNTVTAGAGVDIAADINTAMSAVETDGYTVSGHYMRNNMQGALRGLRDTTNAFIFQSGHPGLEDTTYKGTIFNLKAVASMTGTFEDEDTANANAVRFITGDWSQGIIGVRQDIRMDLFKEGVIQDGAGAIQFNLLQQDMCAMRFTARFAFQTPNPINRLQMTEANRFPFAVIRDAA